MPTDDLVPTAGADGHTPVRSSVGARIDQVTLAAIAAALRGAPTGRLQMTLPSGNTAVVGPADGQIAAQIDISTYRALWKCVRRGALGFADAYMAGEIETDNLHGLFHYYLDNAAALAPSRRGVLGVGWRDRHFHKRRANTRIGSRRNIAAHYDLGNDFYRLWLDAGMTYSSAIFSAPEMSLEAAQAEKYRRILDALELASGETVLEIGCGWGGFAEAAVDRGARLTGITISAEQHAEAAGRMVRAGYQDRATIRFEDYRDTRGSYDHVVSIEMIEAVGEENWPTYFGVIADRLKPGGTAVLQAITIHPDDYESYRRTPDFIQRYIFPGGMLPTVDAMRDNAQAAGLAFEPLETFGASYARTLADWRRRYEEAWPRIEALGFDDRFRRMWLYYLVYCEVAFERGAIDVGLYRFRRHS